MFEKRWTTLKMEFLHHLCSSGAIQKHLRSKELSDRLVLEVGGGQISFVLHDEWFLIPLEGHIFINKTPNVFTEFHLEDAQADGVYEKTIREAVLNEFEIFEELRISKQRILARTKLIREELVEKCFQPMRSIQWNVHTPFQHLRPTQLREISKALAIPCHLLLFNLDGNMNIAMSIRTAAVLGCSDVWIVGRRHYDARPEVGSKNYIRVHKIPEITKTFFLEKNLSPYLVEQGGSPIEEYSFKASIRRGDVPCFVMGSESHGIPPEWLNLGFPRLTISQYGLVRSLNVSIAASIILYEYMKQWRSVHI